MKEIQYKSFSLKTHRFNWRLHRPNVCHFELTFGCALHCEHCYTDCYNAAGYLKKELATQEVKSILDKIYRAGVIWLCFSGGDPLARKDFLELYSYAKVKGFIIILFTNAYSMTEELAVYLSKQPPFAIEMTLNAVSEELSQKIYRVKDAFEKIAAGIGLIQKAGLPLKIKTMATRSNLAEIPGIRRFVRERGLKFYASYDLFARLNGDLTPCRLRIQPEEALVLEGYKRDALNECRPYLSADKEKAKSRPFQCAVTIGDSINIDPYGNIVPCDCIREPRVNLLEEDIGKARSKILRWTRRSDFYIDSECRACAIRGNCISCPGRACLEKGSLAGKVDWLCNLARLRQGAEEG